MDVWKKALRDGVASGAWAAMVSGIVLAVCGRREEGAAAGPLGAPSKWVLGDGAAHDPRPGPAQTLGGHLIHTGATILWATLFERWRHTLRGPHAANAVAPGAMVTAAAACFGDYCVVPRRFTPGFERRLSRRSLFFVYLAIAGGLASWRVRATRGERNLPRQVP